MAEYIKKSDIKKAFLKGFTDRKKYPEFVNWIAKEAERIVNNMPTADVQPVVHAYWIPQGDDMWLCSNCLENKIFSMHESDRTEKQRFCCRCGARMDGDTNG